MRVFVYLITRYSHLLQRTTTSRILKLLSDETISGEYLWVSTHWGCPCVPNSFQAFILIAFAPQQTLEADVMQASGW